MAPTIKDLQQKQEIGERDLEAWLKKNGFSYIYVRQNKETFAPLFQGNLKRPDFLVLLESVGLIAVDAKNRAQSRGEYTLPYEKELRRAMTFERLFRIPIWYAYRGEKSDIWYWISALKAVAVGEVRDDENGEQFLAIKLDQFERIESNSDFGKLYTHRLPGLGKIKDMQH